MDVGAYLKGLVRGSVDSFRHAMLGPQGDVKTSAFLPKYAQLVAENRVWRAIEAAATASVTALPTTASLFTIANNEPDDGNWYVVLNVHAFNAANAAALDQWGLAACISQKFAVTGGIDVTTAQDQARSTVKSMLGGRAGLYQGHAIVDTGVAITDDEWFPLGTSPASTTIVSATGSSMSVDVDGLIVLPPKSLLGLVSTATSTSNTTVKGVIWAEVPKSYLLGA